MLGFRNNKNRADFERICNLFVNDRKYRKRGWDFGQVCSSFKTGRVTLDNMIYDVVGMSGDDVLARLPNRKPLVPL